MATVLLEFPGQYFLKNNPKHLKDVGTVQESKFQLGLWTHLELQQIWHFWEIDTTHVSTSLWKFQFNSIIYFKFWLEKPYSSFKKSSPHLQLYNSMKLKISLYKSSKHVAYIFLWQGIYCKWIFFSIMAERKTKQAFESPWENWSFFLKNKCHQRK